MLTALPNPPGLSSPDDRVAAKLFPCSDRTAVWSSLRRTYRGRTTAATTATTAGRSRPGVAGSFSVSLRKVGKARGRD